MKVIDVRELPKVKEFAVKEEQGRIRTVIEGLRISNPSPSGVCYNRALDDVIDALFLGAK